MKAMSQLLQKERNMSEEKEIHVLDAVLYKK